MKQFINEPTGTKLSGKTWGAAANFDLTINTKLGLTYIEKCVKEALN